MVHGKELPVPKGWNSLLPTWEPQVTIARNCRFPEDGTLGSQPGNQRLPLQATAGSQRLELSVANVGTRGYHCKQVPVPRGWNSRFPTWEPWVTIASNCQNDMKTFSLQLYGFALWTGTERLVLLTEPVPECLRLVHGKELPVPKGWNSLLPTWEPQVTIARNCRFPEDGTLGSQPGNHGLPFQATAGSRGWNSRFPTWEAQVTIARNCRFPEVGTLGSQPGNHGLPLQATVKMIRKHFRYNFMVLLNGPVQNAFFAYWTGMVHGKELPVPKGWNSLLPTWEPQVTIVRNCRFPEDGTLGSQPGNQRLPLQATAGSQRLELLVSNLGTTGYHCKELPVPRGWNSCFPTWEPWVTIASNC